LSVVSLARSPWSGRCVAARCEQNNAQTWRPSQSRDTDTAPKTVAASLNGMAYFDAMAYDAPTASALMSLLLFAELKGVATEADAEHAADAADSVWCVNAPSPPPSPSPMRLLDLVRRRRRHVFSPSRQRRSNNQNN